MSAGRDIASIGNAVAVGAISKASPQSFKPSALSRPEGRPVVLSPQQLRLHRALEELGWVGELEEFNQAARLSHGRSKGHVPSPSAGRIL
jgi:hypothetical protein